MTSPEFSDYLKITSTLARRALEAAAPEPEQPAVAWAVTAARLLLHDEPAQHGALVQGFRRLAALGRTVGAAGPPLVDPAGHRRPAYLPLVVHLHLAAFARRYETLPVGQWGACEAAAAEVMLLVRQVEDYAGTPPPREETPVALWQALCLLEQGQLLSRDVDVEVAQAAVHQIVSRPGAGGSLHPRAGAESLDAWTYRELVGLHALSNLALAGKSTDWARRVQQIAAHHLENTQPDNTTNQPWALFAFAWSPSTRSFADQQIHDATAQGSGRVSTPGTPGAPGTPAAGGSAGLVAGLLFADAAHAFSRFTS